MKEEFDESSLSTENINVKAESMVVEFTPPSALPGPLPSRHWHARRKELGNTADETKRATPASSRVPHAVAIAALLLSNLAFPAALMQRGESPHVLYLN